MKLRSYAAISGLLLLVISAHSIINLFRGRTKTNLFQFIASIGLFILLVLQHFNLLNLSFIGGKIEQIIFIAIFFALMLYFFYYRDINKFINRRKMKGRPFNNIENSLFFYCMAKHNPDKINYYYQLGYEPLDNDSINESRYPRAEPVALYRSSFACPESWPPCHFTYSVICFSSNPTVETK